VEPCTPCQNKNKGDECEWPQAGKGKSCVACVKGKLRCFVGDVPEETQRKRARSEVVEKKGKKKARVVSPVSKSESDLADERAEALRLMDQIAKGMKGLREEMKELRREVVRMRRELDERGDPTWVGQEFASEVDEDEDAEMEGAELVEIREDLRSGEEGFLRTQMPRVLEKLNAMVEAAKQRAEEPEEVAEE
jgi:hypothetical protein